MGAKMHDTLWLLFSYLIKSTPFDQLIHCTKQVSLLFLFGSFLALHVEKVPYYCVFIRNKFDSRKAIIKSLEGSLIILAGSWTWQFSFIFLFSCIKGDFVFSKTNHLRKCSVGCSVNMTTQGSVYIFFLLS